LVSDILHNAAGVTNGSLFRTPFEETLEAVFASLRESYESIPGRITKQHLKERVLKIFRVWSEWCLYPQDKLKLFYDTFMGINQDNNKNVPPVRYGREFVDYKEGDDKNELTDEENDEGKVTLEDVSELILPETKSIVKPTDQPQPPEGIDEDDDIDGMPLDEDDDLDGVPLDMNLIKTEIMISNK